jgi:hypothetical protein
MPSYRLFYFDRNGHISGRLDMDCATDEAALARAGTHLTGPYVELWQGDRLVQSFGQMRLMLNPGETPHQAADPNSTDMRRSG